MIPVVSSEAGCQGTLLPSWAQGTVEAAGTLSTGWQSQAPRLVILWITRILLSWDTRSRAQYQEQALMCHEAADAIPKGPVFGPKLIEPRTHPPCHSCLSAEAGRMWKEPDGDSGRITGTHGCFLPPLTRTFHVAPFSLDTLLRLATLLLPLVLPSKSIRKSVGSAGLCQREERTQSQGLGVPGRKAGMCPTEGKRA